MCNGIELQDYLAFISMIISGISLLITIIFNLVAQYQIIKDNEPQLSFSIEEIRQFLYLRVCNTGKTKASNIRINIKKIHNNNDQRLDVDDLFQNEFELYPNEKVQGRVADYGENLLEHVFPYLDVEVTYKKDHFIRKVKYTRKIYFVASSSDKTVVNVENLESINQLKKI